MSVEACEVQQTMGIQTKKIKILAKGESSSPSKPKRFSPTKIYGTRAIIKTLKCPVCFDYPRQFPIFTCNNGHIVCSVCQKRIQKTHICDMNKENCAGSCPTCRNHELGINPQIQDLGISLLTNVKDTCRFKIYGCQVKGMLLRLGFHELSCQFRIVPCLAHHRTACNWEGSLKDMVIHVRTEGCFLTLKGESDENKFKSHIGDFSDAGMSVFERMVDTHWKPILLAGKKHVRKWIYLSVHRSAGGFWFIMMRSLNPEIELQNITIQLEVYKKQQYEKQRFIYVGAVNSHKRSSQEIFNSGKLLLLTDTHIKLLRTEESIFEYDITILE